MVDRVRMIEGGEGITSARLNASTQASTVSLGDMARILRGAIATETLPKLVPVKRAAPLIADENLADRRVDGAQRRVGGGEFVVCRHGGDRVRRGFEVGAQHHAGL